MRAVSRVSIPSMNRYSMGVVVSQTPRPKFLRTVLALRPWSPSRSSTYSHGPTPSVSRTMSTGVKVARGVSFFRSDGYTRTDSIGPFTARNLPDRRTQPLSPSNQQGQAISL